MCWCSSWMYQVDQLYFHLEPKAVTTFYRPSGEWTLVDTATVYREEDEYATARFVIYITRKSAYFVFTFVFPCILLSLSMILVFLLPPESGEKISLQITILLSFTVFQLVLSSSMPQTSDFMPCIGKRCVLSHLSFPHDCYVENGLAIKILPDRTSVRPAVRRMHCNKMKKFLPIF